MFIIFRFIVLGFLTVYLVSCSPEKNISAKVENLDLAQVVKTYSEIVYSTYVDSHAAAKKMSKSINEFLDSPSEQSFIAAKESWISARLPYLQTEVYRFYGGPIDDEDGPEGLLNAWPMDEAYVDYVKGAPDSGIINDDKAYPEITKDLLISLNEKDGEENISCGYHAIEFLLWGQDFQTNGPGERPHTDYTTAANAERRKEFLKITVSLLLENLESLVNEWVPSQANYRSNFLKEDSLVAIQKILSGMTLLSGFELAGERLLVAYESRAQEDEHSCFSDTTHNDAIYDIVGIINVWSGTYKALDGTKIEGPGIRALATDQDPALGSKIDKALMSALDKSKAIPTPFDQAILAKDGSESRKAIINLIEELENVADGFVTIAKNSGINVSKEPEP
ncbi:MAG: imelysin family protein [Verrucomicrobiales bacterium]